MKLPNLKQIGEFLFGFLLKATQNQTELKYVMFNYLYGAILAVVLWHYVIFELCFGIDPFWILYFAVVVFGAGSCLFISMRCVLTLIWLEFLGKTGINILKAIVLVALISGPIENLKTNAKEVVRVFQCSSELMMNLTMSKVQLLGKPFHNAIRETSSNLTQIQDSLDMVKDVVRPITNEIESPLNATNPDSSFSNDSRLVRAIDSDRQHIDARFIQETYVQKLNDRCKLQMENAVKKCLQSFSDAYDRCYDKLPTVVNTLLCWPMKIDALCNVFKSSDTEKVCDSRSIIDNDFGDTYVELKSLEFSLQKHNGDQVAIDTKLSVVPSAEIKTMKEMNQKFNKEIENKSKIVEVFMFAIRKILSIVVLHSILGAYKYYRKYSSDIEFDNRFTTEYFKKIDARRKNKGLMSLLPLKQIERRTIIVSKSSEVKLKELWFMVPFLLKLFFEIMFASCILIFSHLIYVSLLSISEHGEITYHQEGELIIETAVNGTGVVAMLVKQILINFNINENVSAVYSNFQCLPQPRKLSTLNIIKIYGIYALLIFYKWNLAYVQRMRTLVMAIYFPKREKKRILHLYNECLKRRKRMHKTMKKKLLRKLKNKANVEENLLRIFMNTFTPHLNWLRVLPCLRNKCLICNKTESLGQENLLINSNEIDGLYCYECWEEYSVTIKEIQNERYSAYESQSSQETNGTESSED